MTRYLTLAVRTVTAAMLCRAAWQTARAAGAEVAGVVADVRALRALRADFAPVELSPQHVQHVEHDGRCEREAFRKATGGTGTSDCQCRARALVSARPSLSGIELEPDPAAEVSP